MPAGPDLWRGGGPSGVAWWPGAVGLSTGPGSLGEKGERWNVRFWDASLGARLQRCSQSCGRRRNLLQPLYWEYYPDNTTPSRIACVILLTIPVCAQDIIAVCSGSFRYFIPYSPHHTGCPFNYAQRSFKSPKKSFSAIHSLVIYKFSVNMNVKGEMKLYFWMALRTNTFWST